MTTLYVTSVQEAAGKTMVCAGLGKHLVDKGKKVGFLKVIFAGAPTGDADRDALFMKGVLGLKEPVEDLSLALSAGDDPASRLEEAVSRISSGKDTVIIEAKGESGEVGYEAARALGARVVVVEGYSRDISPAVSFYQPWGELLLGVVVNKVPGGQMERASAGIAARFGQAGINVLGILPEDRALYALTIGELSGLVHGEMLNDADRAPELVESLMIGAMVVDSGLRYFGRKDNKAVIARAVRPDLHLAALETATKCLVVAGGAGPIPAVLRSAQDKHIPIILTGDGATTAIANVEDALDKARFNQERKLPRLAELMGSNFDFGAVYRALGLTG